MLPFLLEEIMPKYVTFITYHPNYYRKMMFNYEIIPVSAIARIYHIVSMN